MTYKETIKPFVLKNYLFSDDDSLLADDSPLISGGIIDSTGILELIEFIEESYRIRVAAEEMVPANFESIDAISSFLDRRVGS